MKVDRRKKKNYNKPFCNGSHEWGDFIPKGTSGLEKCCKHCPATLSKTEYLKLKIDHFAKPERMVIEIGNQHISLFY